MAEGVRMFARCERCAGWGDVDGAVCGREIETDGGVTAVGTSLYRNLEGVANQRGAERSGNGGDDDGEKGSRYLGWSLIGCKAASIGRPRRSLLIMVIELV
ncbi:hypothetical protein FGB62_335g07 [Gracilaria domingensis]|nr:hypothetical protein FGB62_335g07 [Gracilaria domingensis]